MKEAISVKPEKIRLIHILKKKKKGSIKIPIFQREFIWTGTNILELFDSIEKSYPIGSLLFWKPEEEYRYKEEFGQYIVPNKSKENNSGVSVYAAIPTKEININEAIV